MFCQNHSALCLRAASKFLPLRSTTFFVNTCSFSPQTSPSNVDELPERSFVFVLSWRVTVQTPACWGFILRMINTFWRVVTLSGEVSSRAPSAESFHPTA